MTDNHRNFGSGIPMKCDTLAVPGLEKDFESASPGRRMEIEMFCLCKAVIKKAANQVSLIDVFDKRMAVSQPVWLDSFVAVAAIRFYKTDKGVHRFEFRVKDDFGHVVVSSTEIVSISELAEDSTTYFLERHFPASESAFGLYWFSIEADGRELRKIPLYVLPSSPCETAQS